MTRTPIVAAAVALLATLGGAAMPELADSVTAASRSGGTTLRTGKITAFDGAAITVDVGGGQLVAMPFLDHYKPILGDTVQVLQAGAVSIALGRTNDMPDDNAAVNPSFETDPADSTTITAWTATVTSGSASVKTDTATGWGPKHGSQWLEVNHSSGTPSITQVVSDPILVAPGDRWTAAAWVVSTNETGFDEPTFELRLAFFPDAATAYPSFVSETRVSLANGPTGPDWHLMRAVTGSGVEVPANTPYMRVVLETQLYAAGAYWDKVIARRVS